MRYRLLIFRILTLVALMVSVAQLADHLLGLSAFCSPDDGCERVTASAYGNPLGVPLSAVGVVGFASLFILSQITTPWATRIVRILAGVAGVVGVGLLIIQVAVLHQICRLCLIVDSSSIALAVIAAIGFPEIAPTNRFRLLGWIVAAAVAVLLPIGWASIELPEPVPKEIQAYWKEGEINIVEVTDFECPYCRLADRNLRVVLARHPARVVRLVCPLAMHPHAATAANAYLAAEDQGKGEEMAELLYKTDEGLTAQVCENLAKQVPGLDLEKYREVANNPETESRYTKTQHWIKSYQMSLPAVWVQSQRLKGTPSVQEFVDAIRRARPYHASE
jgi:uncharacterized membrane protein/predicted DsbA family dithiol-disulfide isomerase